MTFFGILILLIGLAIFGSSFIMDEKWVGDEKVKQPIVPKFITRWWSAVSIFGVVLTIVGMSYIYAKPGIQYFVTSPTGQKSAIMNEGVKFIVPFSIIQEWPKFVDVKAPKPLDNGEMPDLSEIEGVMDPVKLRFIDQVTAKAYPSIRYQMPNTKESFIEMAIKFRSLNNLVMNTLIDATKEQLLNTGYMYAAQDYISGSAQGFRQTFEESLKGGAYKVKKITIRDTVYENIQNSGNRGIKQIQTSYKVEKVLFNGVPVRVPHEITSNNIIVSQVILSDVVLEPTFKKRLEKQRDESALRQLEQQKTKTAKDKQARIIAEGETSKASERVEQEIEQVKTLIAIETKLKEEETNRELAAIQLETERLKTKTVKVKADADYYKNLKLVAAGLTPQERMKMEIQKNKDKWDGVSKIKFPTTVVQGVGGSKGESVLSSLLGAQVAKDMNK